LRVLTTIIGITGRDTRCTLPPAGAHGSTTTTSFRTQFAARRIGRTVTTCTGITCGTSTGRFTTTGCRKRTTGEDKGRE